MSRYTVWLLSLIVFSGIVAVTPVLVGSYLVLRGLSTVMLRTIGDNLTQTAADKAAAINQWITERILDIKGLSGNEAVRRAGENPQRRQEAEYFLKHIRQNYGYYDEISITGQDGRRLVTTLGPDYVGSYAPDVAAMPHGRLTVSDVRLTLPDSEPAMHIIAPLSSTPPSLLVAQLNLNYLDSITQDIHLGKTGDAYLLNRDGYFITGSRFEPNVRLRRRADTRGYRNCLTAGKGVDIYPGYRNEIVLGSYSYIPDRQWCLMVEQGRNEALEPIRKLRIRAFQFSLAAMALAFSLGALIATAVVRHMRQTDALLEAKSRELTRAERLAATGRLAAGVVHEINNSISSVLNCAALMLNKVRQNQYDPDYFRRFLTAIETECRRTAGVIREFLSFARTPAPQLAPTNLRELLEETLVLLAPAAEQRGIRIQRNWPSDLPAVVADREQLKQAFRNIILNAFDAMPQGGRLRITLRRRDKKLEIEFADTGVGIPAADIHRIFDPFFTTKPAGSGLGLSVVYGIIDAHDGRIEVTSEPGQGTSFTVVLPEKQPGVEPV